MCLQKKLISIYCFATTTLRATDGILVGDVENLLVNIVAAARFGNWHYLKCQKALQI